MNTQYKVEVMIDQKVSKYFVVNANGTIHSKWLTFHHACTVSNDLNRMIKQQLIMEKNSRKAG